MIAVDAAHWWGPAGWLYRNDPGNLSASGICFLAGFVVGSKALKGIKAHFAKLHDHNKWHAQVTKAHAESHGITVPDHPHHDLSTP